MGVFWKTRISCRGPDKKVEDAASHSPPKAEPATSVFGVPVHRGTGTTLYLSATILQLLHVQTFI